MGKGRHTNQMSKTHKSKTNEPQNYGKGRPKKKEQTEVLEEQFKQRLWFNVKRSFNIFTHICEKGSLALRYKTGQRSIKLNDQLKNRKTEETKVLKLKLKDLKRECGYDEKLQYLLIEENTENTEMAIVEPTNAELISDMNLIYRYIHKEFRPTFDLIVMTQMQHSELDSMEIANKIIQAIQLNPSDHVMLLNLALIKINIEDDLEHVLKLANAEDVQNDYQVAEKWVKDEQLIESWLLDFLHSFVLYLSQQQQQQ